MKKILLILFALLASVFTISGADFYTTYDFTYSANTPSSVYVTGGECIDSTCSDIINSSVEIFETNAARTCWINHLGISTDEVFNQCMAGAKINGNVAPGTSVTTKVKLPSTFGHVTYFSASSDSYIVMRDRSSGFSCNFDICFDVNRVNVGFYKKANAIAEIGQLNIKNIDNKNLPVQIEVPVQIEETVCSAFRYTNNNIYTPTIPLTYSDYSANTQVTLVVTDANTNAQYYTQSINLPIEADTCAGLAAFSWTPSSTLQNTAVKFSVETQVIDNQVSSTIKDSATVTETVYPTNLDGTCWSRAYDFTLSNTNSFELNTSVAQINVGESLFALFSAGAFKDNAVTPTQFEARLFFNNNLVLQQLITTPVTGVQDLALDLTSSLTGLASGSYEVRLETNPVGVCTTSSSVIQTQNLELTTPETFGLNFIVQNENSINLQNANVQLQLLNADEYFVTAPTININQQTNNLGQSTFANLYRGTYKYTVSLNGYQAVSNEIYLGTDANLYVTLPVNNSAPLIDLPQNISVYYQNTASIDLRNYIMDANNAYSELTITSSVISGTTTLVQLGSFLTASTTTPNNAVVSVTVKDPAGASTTDTVTIMFTNNQPPVISLFDVTVDNEAAPVNTTFYVTVTDADSAATCTLEFGDGTSTNGACNTLNGLSHIYTVIGTYTAKLTATDGDNTVYATKKIFVFERVNPSPHIDYFKITSSNGVIVPTNIEMSWSVTHESGLATTCTIRVLGEDTPVNCVGTMSLSQFNTQGTVTFNLIADDTAGNQVVRSVPITFYDDGVIIMPSEATLNIADVVVPGKFKFGITLPDEIALERHVSVGPIITCGGVDNLLKTYDGYLDTSFISSSIDGMREFEITANTRDFELNLLLDVNCQFSAVIVDDFGSALTLSKTVMFSYPKEPVEMTSIRGKSTDIINYMTTALAGKITKGYNSIEFTLANNDNSDKEITMTVISSDLGIDHTLEEVLGPGQERNIHFPIFINENVKPGTYPLRIGVYDGTDKQVRYTYLRVE